MKGLKTGIVLLAMLNIVLFCTPPPDINKEETINNIHLKGKYTNADKNYFAQFFQEMQDAVNTKNAEKAFSFYSKDFMSDSGINLEELKKNTILVYKVYTKIKYEMKNISVHIQKTDAVSIDNYIYSAKPKKRGYKPLNYSGKERIYWKKEGDTWKIINWVYE